MTRTASPRALLIGCCILGCSMSDGGSVGSQQGALGSTSLTIRQVYGGGGNLSSTYTNDFISLFNPGFADVSVEGWSVQYAGPVASNWQVTNLSGVVEAHHYYLIQELQGLGGTTPLPTPDAVGMIPMGSTTGKVALLRTQTPLTCSTSCLPNADIVDFVGYGASASSFEGSGPAPTLSNSTAASRSYVGFIDTDDNAADFAAGRVEPQNSQSCFSANSPTGGATGSFPCNGGSGGNSGGGVHPG